MCLQEPLIARAVLSYSACVLMYNMQMLLWPDSKRAFILLPCSCLYQVLLFLILPASRPPMSALSIGRGGHAAAATPRQPSSQWRARWARRLHPNPMRQTFSALLRRYWCCWRSTCSCTCAARCDAARPPARATQLCRRPLQPSAGRHSAQRPPPTFPLQAPLAAGPGQRARRAPHS